MKRCLVALAGCFLLAGLAAADNWPAWRGPRGDGHSNDKDAPLTWSKKDNVRWKAKLPGPGNSTPIVWGDRVFVTQSLDKKGHQRALLCFDRKDGSERWRKVVEYGEDEPTHNTNPFCSASPVTDGNHVYVSHASAGLFCYDWGGKEVWRYDLGELRQIWGTASSPILFGDMCILWCGPGKRQFLLAVDKKSGQKVWQHDEPGGKFGKTSADWLGSWTTPQIVHVGDHEELVLGVPRKVKGFDPKTGKELWSCDGAGPLVYTSPAASADGTVVIFSGYGGAALAVMAGGTGDVTKTHRLWHQTKGIPQRIGSPVIVGEHGYLLSENEEAWCFDRLYVPNQEGDCYVLRAAPKFEQLAVNSLGERMLASPAVADGEIYLRTYQHLWCLGGIK
jgi:outer membrane protein assembly factor BamB